MNPETVARRLRASATLRRIGKLLGGHAFLAGGALRDRILGRSTHDLDLVVAGDPREAAERLAAAFGGRPFRLGREPLVVWRVPARPLEFDVWRLDGTPERDAMRRDFTVNALLWRLPAGPLVDVVGGVADLASGRLRPVSTDNLEADPLRVLRGIRLLATHPELTADEGTLEALRAAAPGLRAVAPERVRHELEITLAGPSVAGALRQAARLGILSVLLARWGGANSDLTDAAALTARELRLLALRRGALGSAAAAVAPGVLLVPPGAENDGLEGAGWPPRTARRIENAVAAAGTFPHAVSTAADSREAAAAAGPLVAEALAWRVARDRCEGRDSAPAAARLLAWRRRFDVLPPLLAGDEIAALLGLPPGPARARAVAALRLVQARGDAHDRASARRWLLAVHGRD